MLVLLMLLAMPLPWRYSTSNTTGLALRLDGRLQVAGEVVDPPGGWSWLVSVGRPQLAGEALYARMFDSGAAYMNVRSGTSIRSPQLSEPAAAAVGLRHAGRQIPLGLLVEARGPLLEGYPDVAVITSVDGIPLTDRSAWERATSAWGTAGDQTDPVTFRLADGRQFTAPGPGLPYASVHTLEVAPPDLHAGISFRLAGILPWEWFRSLSLGRSHGMMVALTTYAAATGEDLAQGRHIAGTGGIRGDGAVTYIGSLPAKAEAANRAGVDVLLVPKGQAHELRHLELPGTTVVPVRTLQEAIDWLQAPVA